MAVPFLQQKGAFLIRKFDGLFWLPTRISASAALNPSPERERGPRRAATARVDGQSEIEIFICTRIGGRRLADTKRIPPSSSAAVETI